MDKLIEEMALDIMRVSSLPLEISGAIATDLAEIGYRKQELGEWKPVMQEFNYYDTCKCSVCDFEIDISLTDYKYCPNCSAKMKGAE